MRMEQQVVSFDLSKEVKEMGLLQNGICAWYQFKNKLPYANLKNAQNNCDDVASFHDGYAECPKEICDAPTVAELGEMLPIFVSTSKIAGIPSIGYRCFFSLPPGLKEHYEEATIEADVRVKMWVFLKKEKIIK